MAISLPVSQHSHAHATFFERAASMLSPADAAAANANEHVIPPREAARSSITYRLTSDFREYWNLGGIQLTKSGAHVPVTSRWVIASSTQPGYDAADLFQDWTFRTPSKMAWSPAYQAEGPPYWVQWEAGDADTVKICQSAHAHETVTLTRSDRPGSIQLPLKRVLNTWVSFSIGQATGNFDLPVDCPSQRISGFDAAVDINPSAKTSRLEQQGREHCVHSLFQRDADFGKCSECQRWILVGEKVTACLLCNHYLCALCHPQEHPQTPVWQGFFKTLGVGLREGQACRTKFEKEIQMEMDSLRSVFHQCQRNGYSQESFEQPVEVPADGLVPKRIELQPERGERFFAMISRLEDDTPFDEGIGLQEVDKENAVSSCVPLEELSKQECAIDVQLALCSTSEHSPKELASKYDSYLHAVAHTEASEIADSISKPADSAVYPTSAHSSKGSAGKHAACTKPAAHTESSKMADSISKSVSSIVFSTSNHSPKGLAEKYAGCLQPCANTEASKPAGAKERRFSSNYCSKGQGESLASPQTPRWPTDTWSSGTHLEHSQLTAFQVAVAPVVTAVGATKNLIGEQEESLARQSENITKNLAVAKVLEARLRDVPVATEGASRVATVKSCEENRISVEEQDFGAIEQQGTGTTVRVYNALWEALEGLLFDNAFIASATNNVQILSSKVGDLAVHIKDGVVHATGQVEAEYVHVKATIIEVKGNWSLSPVEAITSAKIQYQDAAQATMIQAGDMKKTSVAVVEAGEQRVVTMVGHSQDLAGVHKLQAIAAGALVGASAGGATGFAAGFTAGVAVGLLFLPFTLGLSLPIGAVIGSSTGTGLGAVAGTTLGAIGGKCASEKCMDAEAWILKLSNLYSAC